MQLLTWWLFVTMQFNDVQYYLEKNLDARERELEREAEIEEKAPKVKAKSKMSKVRMLLIWNLKNFAGFV